MDIYSLCIGQQVGVFCRKTSDIILYMLHVTRYSIKNEET